MCFVVVCFVVVCLFVVVVVLLLLRFRVGGFSGFFFTAFEDSIYCT